MPWKSALLLPRPAERGEGWGEGSRKTKDRRSLCRRTPTPLLPIAHPAAPGG